MASSGWWSWIIDAYLRPRRFLRTRHAQSLQSSRWAPRTAADLVVLLVINFVTYTVPIAAAWSLTSSVDPIFATAALGIPFLYLTGMTAWAFHAGLVLTGNALSLVDSLRSTIVAVSIYLGVGLGTALPYLVDGRTELALFFRTATMLAFTITGREPVGTAGQFELAVGVVGFGYYVLAVYLVARIAYTASPRAAAFVTALTVGTPLVSAPLLYNPPVPSVYFVVLGCYVVLLSGALPLDLLRRFRIKP